jgi:hypothetical protein
VREVVRLADGVLGSLTGAVRRPLPAPIDNWVDNGASSFGICS